MRIITEGFLVYAMIEVVVLPTPGQGERLPGFVSGTPCWKCRGTGIDPRKKKCCGICEGRGVLHALEEEERVRAGKVSRGRPDAPGPEPAGGDSPGPGETLCCLCGKWRIFQKKHRYSTEDVVTSWMAKDYLRECHVDLGTGVGSVLQMVAWHGDHESLGIEAQADSMRLAQRSVAYNGISSRCRVVLGDMRTAKMTVNRPVLVTGTPPYFDIVDGQTRYGAIPKCEQSAGARYEFRGGVEAYCEAAVKLLRQFPEESRFVCCEGGLDVNENRIEIAAEDHGLRLLRRVMVYGKVGKSMPLFGVWAFRLMDAVSSEDEVRTDTLEVRDMSGHHTPEYAALLKEMGFV